MAAATSQLQGWALSAEPTRQSKVKIFIRQGGGQKTQNLHINNCMIILTCLTSVTFKVLSPSDATHLSRCFFHCSKQFLSLSVLMPFSASAVLFYLFHICKTFPFEDFFIQGNKQTNKQKSHLGQDQVNRESGAWGSCHFWSKTLRAVWGGAFINHPSWNGQICWKSLQKNSVKLNTASHNNASCYTDTNGFL